MRRWQSPPCSAQAAGGCTGIRHPKFSQSLERKRKGGRAPRQPKSQRRQVPVSWDTPSPGRTAAPEGSPPYSSAHQAAPDGLTIIREVHESWNHEAATTQDGSAPGLHLAPALLRPSPSSRPTPVRCLQLPSAPRCEASPQERSSSQHLAPEGLAAKCGLARAAALVRGRCL